MGAIYSIEHCVKPATYRYSEYADTYRISDETVWISFFTNSAVKI
jgi:hypothetical protein